MNGPVANRLRDDERALLGTLPKHIDEFGVVRDVILKRWIASNNGQLCRWGRGMESHLLNWSPTRDRTAQHDGHCEECMAVDTNADRGLARPIAREKQIYEKTNCALGALVNLPSHGH